MSAGLGWIADLTCLAASAAEAPVCAPAGPMNTSMFDPATEQTRLILDLTWLVLGICAVIFVIVEGLILYAIVRYRRRAADPVEDPSQCYGSGPIELAWTVAPIVIVVVLTLVSARGIFHIDRTDPPPGSLDVTVVGHRWWWEFRYPQLGIVTANELVLPAGTPDEPRPAALALRSADVVHSFWVPRLAGKMDVFPDKENLLWFDPVEPGTYFGQCAEYCGTQHAHMLIRVEVVGPDAWDAWVRNQQAPGPQAPAAARGRETFLSLSCVSCHTVAGTTADGTFGPDLTHLMSRATLGAGVIMNTPEGLGAWLADPQSIKPGCDMPDMKLDPSQLDLVRGYLETLK